MQIDKSQFYQVFFEETSEHLAEMERLLVNLDINSPDGEDLNAIFRAAHSIKGASSTFGFQDLAEAAHTLESVLDKVRRGILLPTNESLDLFLRVVDLLKEQLSGHKDGVDVDPKATSDLCERLIELAEGEQDHESVKERADVGAGLTLPKAMPMKGDGCSPVVDPGYGFFEEVNPPAGDGGSPVEDNSQRADVGAGLALPKALPVERDSRSPEKSGRRVTDNTDQNVIRDGRRASDRFINRSQTQLDASSIRVSVKKVDHLINQVGELVITQSMLAQTAAQIDPKTHEKLEEGLAQLERNTRDLQESVMGIRMMPISVAFGRFPRMVRDMAGKFNKQVELRIIGEETELDKGLIEKLVDPLTHLVRNCLDHGIEPPDQRIAAGKEPKGVITLHASHQGGNVVVEVSDDGTGLNRRKILAKALERGLPANESMSDQEVWQLIFAPGFSTADAVTDVSGRGVGMDVVKKNVQAMRGRVEIRSKEGYGSRFIIRLPLTLAIIEGMVVRVGCEVYIVPLISIIESIRPKGSQIKTIVGKGEVVEVRSDYVEIARLCHLFGVASDLTDPTEAVLVIAESGGERVAVLVDELLGKQQVVIKSLEQNYKKISGIAGATILGDGQVAFILDVRGLLLLAREEKGIGVSM